MAGSGIWRPGQRDVVMTKCKIHGPVPLTSVCTRCASDLLESAQKFERELSVAAEVIQKSSDEIDRLNRILFERQGRDRIQDGLQVADAGSSGEKVTTAECRVDDRLAGEGDQEKKTE